jgi:hypothetical protein
MAENYGNQLEKLKPSFIKAVRNTPQKLFAIVAKK